MTNSSLASIARALAACAASATILFACGEAADLATPTAIPSVFVTCALPTCHANATARVFGYWTTSSCAQPFFGVKVTGSGTVTCSIASGCAGSVANWAEFPSGASTTTAPSGSYTLCAVIDVNNDWVNYSVGADSGDAVGSLENVSLTSATHVLTITDFAVK